MAQPSMQLPSDFSQGIPDSSSSGVRAAAWPTINKPQRSRHPLMDTILRSIKLIELKVLRRVLNNEEHLRLREM
jgi:hypothetical protein